MTALNVVRFRVKPGRQEDFIKLHREIRPAFKGYLGGDLIQTGEQTFCIVGQWRSMKALEAARDEMIAILDQLRDMLEDLGDGLGVTDPVSGESVASFKPTKKGKSKKGKGKKKSAMKKKAAKPKAKKGKGKKNKGKK